MILQNPLGLLGLLLIPLLILLKFLRARPRTVVVPSLLIWERVKSEEARDKKHYRYNFLLVLLIQIIAIALLSFAMANPAFVSEEQVLPETVIILDNSIGMASSSQGGPTPLEKAITHLKEWLGRQPETLPVTLIRMTGQENLTSRHLRPAELNKMLDTLAPNEIKVDWADWLARYSPELGKLGPDSRVFLYSYRPLTEAILNQFKVKPIEILFGAPSDNVAITHIGARDVDRVTAVLVTIKNYAAVAWKIPVIIYADNKEMGRQEVSLNANEEKAVVFPDISADNPSVIKAWLEVKDNLECDNTAFLARLNRTKQKVYLVGRQSKYLVKILKAIPSVEPVYSPELPAAPTNAIFIYNNIKPPESADYRKAVVINPPYDFYLFKLARLERTNFQLLLPALNSEIMANVDAAGFHLWQSRGISVADEEKEFLTPLIRSGDDIFLAEYKNKGNHIIICGFDMEWSNPKESDTDWALTHYFPIFWANLIESFSGAEEASPREYGYYKTGDYVKPLSDYRLKSGLFESPDGKVAVNVADRDASDNNGIRQIPEMVSGAGSATITKTITHPFWFLPVLFGLVLLIISWWMENKEAK
jgi:hypothetical protein